jgi:hypothetical protein
MERNGVVTKAYEARDFFVSFLIFQKRKNHRTTITAKQGGMIQSFLKGHQEKL